MEARERAAKVVQENPEMVRRVFAQQLVGEDLFEAQLRVLVQVAPGGD